MKKKIIVLCFALLLALSALFVLTACDGDSSDADGADHVHNYKEKVVAATCEEQGYTKYTCACGDSYKDHYTELKEHAPRTAVKENIVASTCLKKGTYDEVTYCSNCATEISRTAKTEELADCIPASAVQENVVPSTCKVQGTYDAVVYCSVCDTELSRTEERSPLTTHTPGTTMQENLVVATCTAKGSYDAVVYCSVCDIELSRTAKSLEKEPHDITKDTVAATACSPGYTACTCKDCKEYYWENVRPALGHGSAWSCNSCGYNAFNDLASIIKEEGDYEDGEYTAIYYFTSDDNCNSILLTLTYDPTENEVGVVMFSVQYTNQYQTSKELSCLLLMTFSSTKPTAYTYSASVDILSRTMLVSGSVSPGSIRESSTTISYDMVFASNFTLTAYYENYAVQVVTITMKDLLTLLDIALRESRDTTVASFGFTNYTTSHGKHSWSVTSVNEPTCTAAGTVTFTCSKCDRTHTEKVTVSGGHDMQKVSTITPVSCTQDGKDLYECTRCSYSEQRTVTKLGHDISHYTFKQPCCTEKGIERYECSRCDYYKDEDIEMPEHNYGVAETTENYVKHQCADCPATKYYSKYVVKHHQETATAGSYALTDTESFTTWAGTNVTPVTKNYEGFTAPQTQTVTVKEDGTLVIDYYYTRNSYTLTLVTNGGDEMSSITQKHGTTLSLSDATRNEYTFGGWYTDIALENAFTANTMPMADTTIYAYWTEENKPSDFTYGRYTTSNSASIYSYIGTDTTVYIPTYIGGVLVTQISQAFKNCNNITNITIPAGVTSIGNQAFVDCSSLTTITFAKDIQLQSIGEYAFYCCSNITSITIPAGVSTIGSSAFSNCDKLTSVSIPASVTSIGEYAFSGCNSLTSVYINDIAAWYNISFEDSSSNPLTYAHNLYLNNTLVSDLVIPASVTGIGNYAFCGCSNLTSVIFETGSQLQSIGSRAFDSCSSLTAISIPEGVSKIGNYAFCGCSNLTSVIFETGSQLQSIGSRAFDGCSILTGISIPEGVSEIGYYAFYNCSSLTAISIPEGVSEIDNYTFYNCSSLTAITIPASVTSIGENAFKECYKLVEVYNLSSLNITKGSSSNGYVGYYALDIYTNTTSASKLHKVGDYIFYKAGSLVYLVAYKGSETVLTLPQNFEGGSYQIHKYAFYDNDNITSITIPASVTRIGDYAFYRCTNLTDIAIPANVTRIGTAAFDYCNSLIGVYINDIGAWCNISFGNSYANPLTYAGKLYLNNTLVTDLVIPVGIADINSDAFYGCVSLTSVTIPASVTFIGSYAFCYCVGLTDVYISDISA